MNGYWPKAVQEWLEKAKWKLNESLTEEVVRGKQLAKHSICEGTMPQETGMSFFLKRLVSGVHYEAVVTMV